MSDTDTAAAQPEFTELQRRLTRVQQAVWVALLPRPAARLPGFLIFRPSYRTGATGALLPSAAPPPERLHPRMQTALFLTGRRRRLAGR